MTKTTEFQSDETNPFEQLQILLESIEQHPDEQVRNHVRALVYTLLDLHHAAISRMLEIITAQPAGEKILRQFGEDELASAVLMIHDLMPENLETRLENALEIAREQLKIYGADVELVGVQNGIARLKLIGGAQTGNVSSIVIKSEIENVLHKHTPDLFNVEYEDTIQPARPSKPVQIQPRQTIQNGAAGKNFIPIIRANQVPINDFRVVETGGINLLLCNVAGTIHAFQNACPQENHSLEGSLLEEGVLICPQHGFQFEIRRKGRELTNPNLRLESLPSKIENDVVKVAIPEGDL